MTSLAEWQKQQKYLKDVERNRKRRANSFMHKYRGGEHDIKHERQQMIQKNAERDRKRRASIARHNYRGGDHDIKHEKQQKILRDAERERRKRASVARRNYRGGEHDIKYQKEQKVLKDAERDRREDASKLMHSYHGGEHDIKNYERDAIVERKRKNEARRRRSHRIRTAYERMDLSSSDLSQSQLISVAELAAAFNEIEHDNRTKDSGMITATEIPMGSDHDMTNSTRNSVSLRSMVSFSSSQYFDNFDNEDCEADFDANFGNNNDGDEVRSTELYSSEEQYIGESSIVSTNEFGLDNSFVSGDFSFDQTDSNENYYDWTAIPSDEDISNEADDCSSHSSHSICRSHSAVHKSTNSGFLPSETSTSHLIPMGSNEREYFDWTAAPSGTDSELEVDDGCNQDTISSQSEVSNNHASDSDVFHDWTSGLRDSGSSSSSETSSIDVQRLKQMQMFRQKFTSLRGIMFNNDVLESFRNSNIENFYDAKQELEGEENFSESCSRDTTPMDPRENDWRKSVRFCEDGGHELDLRNTSNPYSSDKLDIFEEALEDFVYYDTENPNNISYSKVEFYKSLYDEEKKETGSCGYDSEDDYKNLHGNSAKVVLSALGGVAVSGIATGISKLVSAVQKSARTSRMSTEILLEEIVDAAHAAELVADSTSAASAAVSSTSASTAAASAAASSTSASTAAASAAASSASASTAAASAAASSVSAASATSSASLALSSAGTAAVGQGTAVVAQTAMLQTMAVSAAGTASSSIAGASSAVAAVASATSLTATATVSTTTTVAATTAALGVVAISTGAVVAPLLSSDCRENPVDTMARVKISFPLDTDNSLAMDVMEGIMGWKELGDQIVYAYNNASNLCDETYRRSMANCTYKDHEIYNVDGEKIMIDTYWEPFVTCDSLCPILDPLFGVDVLHQVPDVLDPVPSLLHGFDPILKQKKQLDQGILFETEGPTESPLDDQPRLPVNRTDFLQRIGASSIEPSPGLISFVIEDPDILFQVEMLVEDEIDLPMIEQMAIDATMSILEESIPSRRLAPNPLTHDFADMNEIVISATSKEIDDQTVAVDLRAKILPSAASKYQELIENVQPETFSRQFENKLSQGGIVASVASLDVQSEISMNEEPFSQPLPSSPPLDSRKLSGTNLFHSEGLEGSVTRDHDYDNDFKVLEYLNTVSRMEKGQGLLSDIMRGPSPNEASTSDGKKRAIVAYSAPTSLDYSDRKNAMYFKNFHYFLDHGINCDKHSTVIVTTKVVADEYRARIQEANDALCRHSSFTIKILEREDKCYDMESMATFVRETDSSKFDYFLYINCGVVGPKMKSGQYWTETFTSRLSQTVKLTGVSINMSFHPHVQSFVLATDRTGIEIIKDSGAIYDCGIRNDASMTEEEKWNIIERYEIGMSKAIINAGYSINSLTGSFGESITINKDAIASIIKRSNQASSSEALIPATERNVWDSNSANFVLPLGDDIWNANTIRTIGKGHLPTWSDFIFYKASRGILLPEIFEEVRYDEHGSSLSLVEDLGSSLPNYEDPTIDICAEAEQDFRGASKLSVIVTGFEHSGTTMLSQLIKSAPGLFGGFECGILAQERQTQFYDWFIWPVQQDLWGMSSESREMMVNAKCIAEAYHILWQYSPLFHYDPNQNSMIVDKTPGYLEELVKVMDQTPGVPVVIAEKSLSSLYASYRKRGISDEEIHLKISRLSTIISDAMKKYPGRIHIANTTRWYEEPDEVMGGVFDFLGLEWRSEYLTMEALNSKRVPGSVFSRPFDTSRV